MAKFRRKGIVIVKAIIDVDGILSTYSDDGELVKLTRYQRNIIHNYKSNNYISDIKKAFNNQNIVSDNFIVIKNNVQVYPRIK